jgi:hypothetical protein
MKTHSAEEIKEQLGNPVTCYDVEHSEEPPFNPGDLILLQLRG